MSILSEHAKLGYKQYITRYESAIRRVIPLNTTGRSKEQIVADMESGTLSRCIVSNINIPIAHNEQCKCLVCFNVRLDTLLKVSEEVLKCENVQRVQDKAGYGETVTTTLPAGDVWEERSSLI